MTSGKEPTAVTIRAKIIAFSGTILTTFFKLTFSVTTFYVKTFSVTTFYVRTFSVRTFYVKT